MGGLLGKLVGMIQALYVSKEADRAVKEAETMSDLIGKLLPVAIGLLVAGVVASEGSKKWPTKKGV